MRQYKYYWFGDSITPGPRPKVLTRLGLEPGVPVSGVFFDLFELERRCFDKPDCPRLGRLARSEALFRGLIPKDGRA